MAEKKTKSFILRVDADAAVFVEGCIVVEECVSALLLNGFEHVRDLLAVGSDRDCARLCRQEDGYP